MRLFVAINLSDETRWRLVSLRDELQQNSSRGSFSRSENIHLTLLFLGECSDAQAAAAKAAMYETEFDPFTMTMDRTGTFRRYGTGTLWWAGIKKCEPLEKLYHELSQRTASKGLLTEGRKYSPHITFARDVITKMQPKQIEPFTESVTSIDLMRSERINDKLTYSPLYKKKATE